MKKIYFYLLLCVLIFPISVYAGVSMTCDSGVKSGGSFSCRLNGSTNYSSVKATLVLPNGFGYTGNISSVNGTKTSYVSKGTGTSLEFTSSANGTFPIATLNLTAPEVKTDTNYTITLNSFTVLDGSGSPITTQTDISKTIKVYGETTTTSAPPVTTSKKTFTVSFDANGGNGTNTALSCETTSDNCSINLSGLSIPTRTGYTFAGWGTKNTCTSGNKTTYNASANTTLYACWVSGTTSSATSSGTKLYLKNLAIEGQTLEFSKFKFTYSFEVLYSVENLKITAEAANDNVKVAYDANPTLKVGENKITITLTDTANNTTTYNLTVTRLKEGEKITTLSSDATLKSLVITDYSLNFSPTVTNYNLTVGYKVSSLTVKCTPNDSKATCVTTGNLDINTGSVIKVTVKATDGTLNVYKINITKSSFLQTYLMYLIIGGAALLLIIILAIISYQNKKRKSIPKTTVIKKQPPIKKAQVKADPKSNVEVLKM